MINTIYDFQLEVERILKGCLFEEYNDDTESRIINEISELVDQNQHLDLKDFGLEFDDTECSLKMTAKFEDTEITFELKKDDV